MTGFDKRMRVGPIGLAAFAARVRLEIRARAEVTSGAGQNRYEAVRIRIELAKRCGELERSGGVDGVTVLRPFDLHYTYVVDLLAGDTHGAGAQLVFGFASGRGTVNDLSTAPA